MPRIIRFHQVGGPENLKFEEEATRQPGPGEVRLKIQAVGLNRAESMYYHGAYLEQPVLPSRLGYEVAGIVEAVGEGVDAGLIGKQVATVPGFSMNQWGLLGEEGIVPASRLAAYPPKLSPVEGAAIWMQYLTAWGALIHFGAITAEDFVLISAASSSVGLAAIEIAKDAGAVVIAATRTAKKRDELLALGANFVIATEEEDFVARVNEITSDKGARIIFDPIGGPFVEKLAEAAAHHAILFEYGALSPEPTPFPLFPALSKALTLRGYTLHEIVALPDLFEAAKKYIYDRLADGRFSPKIAKIFPFAETVAAYQYLESNAQVGKIVIEL